MPTMTLAPPDGNPPSGPSQGLLGSLPTLNPLEVLANLQLERKKAEWAQWIGNEHVAMRNQRRPFERQWYINLAFYLGKQNIAVTSSTASQLGFQLVVPKSPPWRVRMVVNKIRTMIRTECAKLTSNLPIPVVMPATTEDEDFAASQVGENILKAHFATAEFQQILRDFVFWGSITGNSYIKSWWGAGELDDNGTPGKICEEVITPFHVYVPNILETNIQKQPYVFHVMTKDPRWVEQQFGVKVNADVSATTDLLETSFLNLIGTTDKQRLDSAMYYEVWIKPGGHPDFPRGGLLSMAGGKILQVIQGFEVAKDQMGNTSGGMVPFNDYPFYKFRGIPTGQYYDDSIIVDLIPLQKEYNRTKSQLIETKNLVGKTKIIAPRGSINPRQINTEPGQAVLFEPGFGFAPQVVPPPDMPSYIREELDRLLSDMDDISGQHEITRGNTPSQVTSGTAISYLQDQDDTKLAYQTAGIEYAVTVLGRHYLKYVTMYWDAERIVKIVGRNEVIEAMNYQASDLRGNTDVRVVAGSGLPTNKAAKQAFIMDLAKMGLIPPEQVLELLEIGNFEKIMEDFYADKKQVQRENLKMAKADPNALADYFMAPGGIDPNTGQPVTDPSTGLPPPPQPPLPANTWDNHQLHIMIHNQYRKTQDFELLPDAIKFAFELHVRSHQMALMVPQTPTDQYGNAGADLPPAGDPNAGDPNAQPDEAASETQPQETA